MADLMTMQLAKQIFEAVTSRDTMLVPQFAGIKWEELGEQVHQDFYKAAAIVMKLRLVDAR